MLTIKDPKNFDWSSLTLSDLAEGNAQDVFFTLKLHDLFKGQLVNMKQHRLCAKPIAGLLGRFAHKELNGYIIDEDKLEAIDQHLTLEIDRLQEELYSYDEVKEGQKFSGKDLMYTLYDEDVGFGLFPPYETKGKQPKTDKTTFEFLLTEIELELERRAIHGKK